MIVKWVKKIPAEEGWYWIKYKNKRKRYTICPCLVTWIGKGVVVHTAGNDTFFAGPNHGGPELKYEGQVDKSVRFGPWIEAPDA